MEWNQKQVDDGTQSSICSKKETQLLPNEEAAAYRRTFLTTNKASPR